MSYSSATAGGEANSPSAEHAGSVIESFTYDDPYVNEHSDRVNAQLGLLSAAGFYGDNSVDLSRKRPSDIDLANPATAAWIEQVPTVADWMALIPTAAALDPIYRPDTVELPSGARISTEMRQWFCNSADARGIRSRAAAFAVLATTRVTRDETAPRWLSLACGAAQPVLKAAAQLRDLDKPIPAMTLLDLDKRSLRLAARYAEQTDVSAHMTLRRANVLDPQGLARLVAHIPGTSAAPEESFDVVEALGLLEYLGPMDWTYRYGRVVKSRKRLAGAVTFLRNAYELVRPGGVLVFANMLDSHPQLAFTLNVVQWPHIQPRSIDSMLSLIRDAGLHDHVRVLLPDDGVYAIYSIEKPGRVACPSATT